MSNKQYSEETGDTRKEEDPQDDENENDPILVESESYNRNVLDDRE